MAVLRKKKPVLSPVFSPMRRRAAELGVTTPRSYLEIAIALTPSAAASCRWLRPASLRAARIRPPMSAALLVAMFTRYGE